MRCADPRSVFLALALIAAVGFPSAATQKGGSAYDLIVSAYRSGDAAAAMTTAAKLNERQLHGEIKALVEREQAAAKAGKPRIGLQTAALVHIECVLALERTADPRAFEMRTIHLNAASSLVRALSDPPRGRRPAGPGTDDAFLHGWFRLMAAHDSTRFGYKRALATIETAREQIGDDPELLLAEGALHELAWRNEHDEGRPVIDVHGDLAVAERALQAAFDGDPRLDEARVRLGHVQAKRGNADAALKTFSRIRPGSIEAALVYLARLFEGDVYLALGRFKEAEAALDEAATVMPAAESGQIALAHLLYATGRRDEAARRVTSIAAGARTDAKDDPWLTYKDGVIWRVPVYLDALRKMVRQ